MSVLNEQPEPGKAVVNFFFSEAEILEEALTWLSEWYGPLEARLEPLPFSHTSYYRQEMGDALKKTLVSFERLLPRDGLVDFKHRADELEKALSRRYRDSAGRPVNVDPGMLLPEKFVLATGKNFPQRIYLGRGVYADLTLIYRQGHFEALPWTYTDYLDPRVLHFLSDARERLLVQLKEGRE